MLTLAQFDSIPPQQLWTPLQTTNVDHMAALKLRIIFYDHEYFYNLARNVHLPCSLRKKPFFVFTLEFWIHHENKHLLCGKNKF